ncbi:MAG: EpsG family protein [Clostridia bacterium]|nr:EpsG family protein [Clostridia bacterium]
MVAYLGYLALAGIQSLFFYAKDKRGKVHFKSKTYLILCCIELILFAGLRAYNIGADMDIYLLAIDVYGEMPILEMLKAPLRYPFDFEIGYFIFTKFAILLGLGKTGFLFLVAIVTYVPIFMAIYKKSQDPFLSILTYFSFGLFSYSLGLFRQMIAISIVLCGRKYILKREGLKFCLFVALAMLFHTTAIISLLLYFLYGINWKKLIWIVIPAEILLLVFGRLVVDFAFILFPKYSNLIGGQYDVKGGSYLMLLFINVVLFACVYFTEKDRFRDRLTICALILAGMLQALGYSMAIFGRIVPYFSTFIIFAIPDLVKCIKKKWRSLVYIATVVFLFALVVKEFYGNIYLTPYALFFME